MDAVGPAVPVPVPTPGPRALTTLFDPRHNSLNAVRLVLAVAVVTSHAGAMTSRGEPELGGLTLGRWAVLGFFFLSGLLITRSRLGRSLPDFARDRALRILPAYVVMLLVVAAVAAPLGAALSRSYAFDPADAVRYVVANLPLAPPWTARFTIGDMGGLDLDFRAWNGPIYTLFYEGAAYVATGLLLAVLPRRWLVPVLGATAVGLTAASLVPSVADGIGPGRVSGPFAIGLPFALAFVWGALAWLVRDRLPVGPATAAGSAVFLALVCLGSDAAALAPLPLGLLLLCVGVTRPLERVGARCDLSYGIYLYGWPVQVLVILAVPRLALDGPLPLETVVVVLLTAAVALASCVLVERPALSLRSRPRGQTAVAPA